MSCHAIGRSDEFGQQSKAEQCMAWRIRHIDHVVHWLKSSGGASLLALKQARPHHIPLFESCGNDQWP